MEENLKKMKNILESKNKKGAMGVVAWIVIVVLLLSILGVGIWKVSQAVTGDKEFKEAEIQKCELAPIITSSGLNAFKPGTSVTLTGTTARLNGEYIGAITSGTTVFNYGDKVDLLMGAADHLNITYPTITMKCGENKAIGKLYGTDAGTLEIYDITYTAPTDGVSDNAINITSVAGTVDFIVGLRGTQDDYTGILLVTVEGNTTQVDEFTVSAKSANGKVIDGNYPVADLALIATDEFSGSSIKYGFLVEGLLDGAYAEYQVSIIPESGAQIGEGTNAAPFYVNVYSSQAGIEIDGTFLSGLADESMFEDEDGTVIYEDKWTDHDFLVE